MIGSATWWEQPGRATQAAVAGTLLAVAAGLIVISGTLDHPGIGIGFLYQAMALLCVLMPLAALAMAVHCLVCAWRSKGWLVAGAILATALSVLLGLASFATGLGVAYPTVDHLTNQE